LGWGTFGVHPPQLTVASCSSGGLEKWFLFGGNRPLFGEIGGFEIWLFGVLWPTFSENSVVRLFSFDSHVSALTIMNISGIMIKTASTVSNNAFLTWNIVAKFSGRCSGVKLKVPTHSSVAVRDRPRMYKKSNRNSSHYVQNDRRHISTFSLVASAQWTFFF